MFAKNRPSSNPRPSRTTQSGLTRRLTRPTGTAGDPVCPDVASDIHPAVRGASVSVHTDDIRAGRGDMARRRDPDEPGEPAALDGVLRAAALAARGEHRRRPLRRRGRRRRTHAADPDRGGARRLRHAAPRHPPPHRARPSGPRRARHRGPRQRLPDRVPAARARDDRRSHTAGAQPSAGGARPAARLVPRIAGADRHRVVDRAVGRVPADRRARLARARCARIRDAAWRPARAAARRAARSRPGGRDRAQPAGGDEHRIPALRRRADAARRASASGGWRSGS